MNATHIFLLFFVLSLSAAKMLAQTEGAPDLSFNGSGYKVQPTGDGYSWASAQKVLQDGKILIAGYSSQSGSSHCTVLRFNSDGSIDPTFASNGVAFIPIQYSSRATAMVVQSDGKIVVAGLSVDSVSNYYFSSARMSSNGIIDSSYAVNGIATTYVEFSANVYGITIQSNGKIVVTGYTNELGDTTGISHVRYKTDGSLDSTFGTGGISIIKSVHSIDVEAWAVAIDSYDRIVTTGLVFCPDAGENRISVARFNPDGSPDTTFGDGGFVETPGNNDDAFGNALAIQPDNKIVIAASCNQTSAVLRYNTDGSLDSLFGTDGITWFHFEVTMNAEAYGIGLQSDGKILVTGVSGQNAMNTNGNFGLARFNTDGTIDTAFGLNGVVVTDLSNGKNDVAFSVQQQFDGKIVVSGISFNGNHYNVALARYHGLLQSIAIQTPEDNCTIYPNPTNSQVKVANLYGVEIIEIMNIQGKLFARLTISEDLATIDFSELPQGIYLLRFITGNSTFVKKVVRE